MTAAATALFALGGIALAVATWLKATEDAHARFVNNSHEETP